MSDVTDTEGSRAIRFIERLKNPEGTEWAGRPLRLLEWQKDYIRRLLDTVDEAGRTRYEKSLLFLPKKQGKTTLIAALALYFLVGRQHQQVTCLAQVKEQAALIYRFVASMIRQDEALADRAVCRVFKGNQKKIECYASDGVLQVLSSDAIGANGLNASVLLFDEVCFSETSELWDAVISGGISREHLLAIGLSTAGMSTSGFGYQFYESAKAILADPKLDPTFLPVIYEAPIDSDWTDPGVYLACSPTFREMGEAAIRRITAMIEAAKRDPSQLRRLRRYHLNQWIGAESKDPWISVDKWDASDLQVKREDLRGQDCWAGIDLSSTTDMTALALVFPLEGEKYAVILRYFMPWDGLENAERRDGGAQYTLWAKQGLIVATPGNSVDYQFIESDLATLSQEFNIREIAYDRWNMSDLVRRLQEKGFKMVPVGQGTTTISPSAKELERIVAGKNLAHFDNPVLRWNISNTIAPIIDDCGNVKPSKKKSTGRIDGVYAMLDALAVELLDRKTRGSGASFYAF